MNKFITAHCYHYCLKDEEINLPRVMQLNLNYRSSALSVPHGLSFSKFHPESFYWNDLHHPKESSDLREASCRGREPQELNDIQWTQKLLKIPKVMFYGVMCHLEEPASSRWLTKDKEEAKVTAEREKVAWAVFLDYNLSVRVLARTSLSGWVFDENF